MTKASPKSVCVYVGVCVCQLLPLLTGDTAEVCVCVRDGVCGTNRWSSGFYLNGGFSSQMKLHKGPVYTCCRAAPPATQPSSAAHTRPQ